MHLTALRSEILCLWIGFFELCRVRCVWPTKFVSPSNPTRGKLASIAAKDVCAFEVGAGKRGGDFAGDASNSVFPNYEGTHGNRTVPYQSVLTDAVGSVREAIAI